MDASQLMLSWVSLTRKKKKNIYELNCLTFAGDGKDEEVAARQMNFPFWRISSHNDLVAFYNALDMGFM